MHFIPVTSASSLRTIISRHFSTHPRLPKLAKIPSKHRQRVVLQAQQALTDYLHATRSLPFFYADHIGKNSLFSLSNLISKIDYSPPDFSKDFIRFLSYHPINEFEFFFESIGIPIQEIENFLPASDFFLSEEGSILPVARKLSAFGFPWNRLGGLYKEDMSIFGKDLDAITGELSGFISLGFDNSSVVGICLAFPLLLSKNDDLRPEVDALMDIIKRVFLDYDLKSSVVGNMDASYEFCRKIKVFIDLGCEKKDVGELMGKSWNVFVECSEEVLVQKVEFFRRLNAMEEDIGMLLLRCPEIVQYDLKSPIFSAMSFLKQFGLSDKELDAIALEYPFTLGKNRMENLPQLMRALNLHEWFFDKIVSGNHHLLANFDIGVPDETIENEYKNCVEKIQFMKNHKHAVGKLNFLLGIGYGENLVTIKVFKTLHGTKSELQERFDYLLNAGVVYSNLCKMIKQLPKILNQSPDVVDEKLKFLCGDSGHSLNYLDAFPGYLCFDLENRIKPRYRIHMWLKENGFPVYSLSSIVATSENRFIERLIAFHPTVLKQWLERFSSKNHYYSLQEN